MYRHWKTEGWSNLMLLFLALILVVNSGIIVGVQLMTGYPYHSDEEILSRYDGYSCIGRKSADQVSVWLLQAPAAENRLILTEKHFFADRYKVALDREIGQDFSASVKTGSGTAEISIRGGKPEDLSWRSSSLPVRFSTIQTRVPASFLLWNLLMLALEILAAVLFHKIRSH